MNHLLKIRFVVVAALSLLLSLSVEGHTSTRARMFMLSRVITAKGESALMSQASRHHRVGRGRAASALTPGTWGGKHIRLEVTERGATIEYDCAHGVVEQRIVVDRAGRFSVAGTHYEEHGGPVHASDTESGYPVRLNGRVGGSLLKLTVTRAGTKKSIGVFNLVRGGEAQIMKCR
jgi:hypothetical protein